MFRNYINEFFHTILEYQEFDSEYCMKNLFGSKIEMIRFFSDNHFNVCWDDICCSTQTFWTLKEKEISPSKIYSIIIGAKPLIIEYSEEFADGDSSEKIIEVWLK